MDRERGRRAVGGMACCLVVNAFAVALGCAQAPLEDAAVNGGETDALASSNGLTSINGLSALNGLSAMNGLSALNGLNASGLVSGSTLMNSAAGRSTVSYMVRCALPAGHSITKKDNQGVSYSFPGAIGLAPQWESGACDAMCQEYVSACLMAHVNTSGQHISIWLIGDGPLGFGLSSAYPYQEGSFFGNIFKSPPSAYYCEGEDFNLAVVPGRLGAAIPGAPYKDPFGATSACKKYCSPNSNGYSNCDGFGHVLTVYRDWDPNTDYQLCSRKSGLCMTLDGGGTADGTRITQSGSSTSTNERFRITAVGPGQYKICSKSSGKCLKPTTTSGSQLQAWSYTGASNQKWKITPHVGAYGYYFFCSVANGQCLEVNDASANGIVNDAFHNITAQEWSVDLAK